MNHSSVVYVPIKGHNNCIYPIYVPLVIKEPEIYKSTGRLSMGDYNESKENLAGFPALLPLLATLAPLVPIAIKGVKKIFGKGENEKKYAISGPGGIRKYNSGKCGYIPTNPNINNLKQLQDLYDKYE